MIGDPPTNTLEHAVISGSATTGLKITLRDGRHACLAILDEDGNVIESGPAVARECWNVAIECHRNFWKAQGHLVVHTSPTGLVTSHPKGKR